MRKEEAGRERYEEEVSALRMIEIYNDSDSETEDGKYRNFKTNIKNTLKLC